MPRGLKQKSGRSGRQAVKKDVDLLRTRREVEHVTPGGKRKVRVASLLLKYAGAPLFAFRCTWTVSALPEPMPSIVFLELTAGLQDGVVQGLSCSAFQTLLRSVFAGQRS